MDEEPRPGVDEQELLDEAFDAMNHVFVDLLFGRITSARSWLDQVDASLRRLDV